MEIRSGYFGGAMALDSPPQAKESKRRGVSGWAAKYNVWSKPIPLPSGRGAFHELIEPGTFTRALASKPDVLGLLEHDVSKCFARTSSGTMTLSDDGRGLRFDVPELPKKGIGPQIKEALKRGDLRGCSFRFGINQPGGDKWGVERVGGAEVAVCRLRDIRISDVSLVSWPAYPETEVHIRAEWTLRSLDAWINEQRRGGKSIQKVILEMLAALTK